MNHNRCLDPNIYFLIFIMYPAPGGVENSTRNIVLQNVGSGAAR